MGGADLYAVIRDGSGPPSRDPYLLVVGSEGAVLSAREDPPIGIRSIPLRKSAPAWRRTSAGLFILLPRLWRNLDLQLALYDFSGREIAMAKGKYGREAFLPLQRTACGNGLLEIRSGGKRLAGTVALSP
jgi:hypothetical protein